MASGQEVVKAAFDSLTAERMHDIFLELDIHNEPCDVCMERIMVACGVKLVTFEEWAKMRPREQGYIQYWQGDRPGSQLKGKENPWPRESREYQEYKEGSFQAMLDAQDSED